MSEVQTSPNCENVSPISDFSDSLAGDAGPSKGCKRRGPSLTVVRALVHDTPSTKKRKMKRRTLDIDDDPAIGGKKVATNQNQNNYQKFDEISTVNDDVPRKTPPTIRPTQRKTPPTVRQVNLPPRPTDSQVNNRNTATSQEATNKANQENKDRIPPIILRDKKQWFGLSSEIRRRGFSYSKAQNVVDGIRLYPMSVADFRGIIKLFDSSQIPYHTFQLPHEKLLNVVIRGIPLDRKSLIIPSNYPTRNSSMSLLEESLLRSL
ncbi:hypothetical protein QE152_g33640 [Popillia japonica]|uniref:Uncharacterized protein n=1 Tax=Popillia japonica TaxID=7064 RepID=A0AAW1IW21_POPJA